MDSFNIEKLPIFYRNRKLYRSRNGFAEKIYSS